ESRANHCLAVRGKGEADSRLPSVVIRLHERRQARLDIPPKAVIESQLGSDPPLVLYKGAPVSVVDQPTVIVKERRRIRVRPIGRAYAQRAGIGGSDRRKTWKRVRRTCRGTGWQRDPGVREHNAMIAADRAIRGGRSDIVGDYSRMGEQAVVKNSEIREAVPSSRARAGSSRHEHAHGVE